MSAEAQITAIKQWIAVEREQNQTDNKALDALEGQLWLLELHLQNGTKLGMPMPQTHRMIYAMAKTLGGE